jgi:thiamine biosynthesis lipoprotein
VLQTERLLHPRGENSDLARIGDALLGSPIAVHGSTIELLKLARRLFDSTDGVFDPCLPSHHGRLHHIEINAAESHVICHAPVALDFGGFGKGYAVDQAIEALISHGCRAGLVNAGGDLRVFGDRTEPMLLRLPDGSFSALRLSETALAVSDAQTLHRTPEHQGYYVRQSADPTVLQQSYAAVLASKAVMADALAKCVMLCSRSNTERVLREFNASLASRWQ